MADPQSPDAGAGPDAAGASPDAGGDQNGAPQGGQLGQLIGNISHGLAMVTSVVSDSGISPDLAKAWQSLGDQFKQLVQQSMGGAQGQAPGSGSHGSGMQTPEQGGAPGAKPASMRY